MTADTGREDETRRNDSVDWPGWLRKPDGMRDDRPGEIGDCGCQGEEAMTVRIVPRCYLREQSILNLFLGAAAVAGNISHVLVEDRLQCIPHIAVDRGHSKGRCKPLAVTRPILSPAVGLS